MKPTASSEDPLLLVRELKRSLQSLALPVEEQVQRFTGTCKPCALLTDYCYYHWHMSRSHAQALTAEQWEACSLMKSHIDEVSRSEAYECWVDEPGGMGAAWAGIRQVAETTLISFR